MKKMKRTHNKRRRSLKKDKRAVSPVIGVIMMIAITVVIAAVVAAFAYGIIGGVTKAPSAALHLEDAYGGSTNITMIHYGGDPIGNAFTFNASDLSYTAAPWGDLELRRNGAAVTTDCWFAMNGTTVGTAKFKAGDELEIGFGSDKPLVSGDSLVVIYMPSGDILQRVKVA